MLGADAVNPGIHLRLIDQATGSDVGVSLGDFRCFPGEVALLVGLGLARRRVAGVQLHRMHDDKIVLWVLLGQGVFNLETRAAGNPAIPRMSFEARSSTAA